MTAPQIKYPGRCGLCRQVVGKAQMTRHLKACLKKDAGAGGRAENLFHLVIEGRYLPMYWLHVQTPGAASLDDLDAFLRAIWLECCGHLSCFTISGQRYSVQPVEDVFWGAGEESMEIQLSNVLSEGTKFTHEYDFGSTTELSLRVVGIRRGAPVEGPGVALLARNDPPEWKCAKCGKPATQIHATGWGLDVDSLVCDACLGDDEDEGVLPLVNSPRTGVCAYSG